MIGSKNLRVLVVDDTIVYRKAVSDIVEEIPGVELAGVAHNGKIALAKITTLKPDILTLDIEMPEMNGIEVLMELQKNHPGVGAIMLSTLTAEGSQMTLRALELGAFDFILKPQSKNQIDGKKELRSLLGADAQGLCQVALCSLLAARQSEDGCDILSGNAQSRTFTGFEQTDGAGQGVRAAPRQVGDRRHRHIHRRAQRPQSDVATIAR
jgi:CheY-like chemotaxis protein